MVRWGYDLESRGGGVYSWFCVVWKDAWNAPTATRMQWAPLVLFMLMNFAVALDIVVIAFAFMPMSDELFDETNFFTNLGVHLGNFMALGFTIAVIILGMATVTYGFIMTLKRGCN